MSSVDVILPLPLFSSYLFTEGMLKKTTTFFTLTTKDPDVQFHSIPICSVMKIRTKEMSGREETFQPKAEDEVPSKVRLLCSLDFDLRTYAAVSVITF